MPDQPQVSVCMPAHRDSELLRAAARSVLAQSFTDLELIITDDSGGELRDVAAALDDARVRYVANPTRLGLAGNHTAAINHARGNLIAFLHDDDEWLPGYLQTMASAFADDPSLGIACADVWIDRGGPWERRRRPNTGRYEDWVEVLMAHNTFIPSSTVVRREVWDTRTRELPDLPTGDLVLYLEAARTGRAMRWIGEPLVRYRMHPGNAGATDEARFRDGLVQIFDGYTFSSPHHEAARRSRLARQLIARGGFALRHGESQQARADLDRARRLDPAAMRTKRAALHFLASHPQLRATAQRARDLFPRT